MPSDPPRSAWHGHCFLAGMTSIDARVVMRDAAVGFVLGLLVMFAVAYGVSSASAHETRPPAASAK